MVSVKMILSFMYVISRIISLSYFKIFKKKKKKKRQQALGRKKRVGWLVGYKTCFSSFLVDSGYAA